MNVNCYSYSGALLFVAKNVGMLLVMFSCLPQNALNTPCDWDKAALHLFFFDKSTPKRISNQAIMICPMVDGKRVAIPVNSPEVYSADNEEDIHISNVTGGCADELARQVIKTIKDACGEADEFHLKAAWQGTSCDSQYQANEFLNTLHRDLDVPVDPVFSEIIWDPSHWTK